MGWRVDDELQQMLRDSAVHYLGTAGGPEHFRKVRASADGFDAATSVSASNDVRHIETMAFDPATPGSLYDRVRIHKDAVEVEEDCLTL